MKKNNHVDDENYGFPDLPHCPLIMRYLVSVGKKNSRTEQQEAIYVR